jgi:hypothetical protein
VTRPPTVQTVAEVTTPDTVIDYPDTRTGPQEVPEPATLIAAAVGLATVAVVRRRRKAAAQRRSP